MAKNKIDPAKISALGDVITMSLNNIYGRDMGFMLCISPFETLEDNRTDFVGNAERVDSINWLRETADRLEKGDDELI